MICYTASGARKELFRILDSVENGEDIIVMRRGVRFRISLDPAHELEPGLQEPLEVEDQDVLSGEWTWTAREDGQLEFQPKALDK